MNNLHISQRKMRQMRKRALQSGVIAALDIGSSNIRCHILRFNPTHTELDAKNGTELSSLPNFRVIGSKTHVSKGVHKGEIEVMVDTESAVRTVLNDAQKMAKTLVNHAIVTFSGEYMRSDSLIGPVELNEPTVTNGGIARAMSACDLPQDLGDTHALHCHPIEFSLDHRHGLIDPRGMSGRNLTAYMHMLSVRKSAVQNITYCIENCGIKVAGITAAPYASGVASMTENELDQGCACIDIGAETTSISIFYKKHMIFANVVALGSQSITRDIAYALKINEKLAERLKTMHGGVTQTDRDDREDITLGSEIDTKYGERRTVSRSELISIIRPRADEIFELVRKRLENCNFHKLPVCQIVLTGGGSQLLGIESVANRVLGYQTRLSQPLRLPGAPEVATNPAHSALAGLCLSATQPQDEWWDFEIPVSKENTPSLLQYAKKIIKFL